MSQILSSRETLFSSLSRQVHIRNIIRAHPRETRLIEFQTNLCSSQLCRTHGALQNSLTVATFLSELAPICGELGLNVEIAAQVEVANALRDQGELSASIRVLRNLENRTDFHKQTVTVTKSEILANLVSICKLHLTHIAKSSRVNKSLKHGYSSRGISSNNILSLQ